MREQIEELLYREDFRNIAIVTTAGLRYDITDPHTAALGKDQLHYYFPGTDRAVHVPYTQISTIEEVQPNRK